MLIEIVTEHGNKWAYVTIPMEQFKVHIQERHPWIHLVLLEPVRKKKTITWESDVTEYVRMLIMEVLDAR